MNKPDVVLRFSACSRCFVRTTCQAVILEPHVSSGASRVREMAAAARRQFATTAIGKSGTPLGAMLTGDCLPPVSSLTRSSM